MQSCLHTIPAPERRRDVHRWVELYGTPVALTNASVKRKIAPLQNSWPCRRRIISGPSRFPADVAPVTEGKAMPPVRRRKHVRLRVNIKIEVMRGTPDDFMTSMRSGPRCRRAVSQAPSDRGVLLLGPPPGHPVHSNSSHRRKRFVPAVL